MSVPFVLRFYGQTDAKIDECIQKIRQYVTTPFTVTKELSTTSQNMFIPTGVQVLNVKMNFDLSLAEVKKLIHSTKEVSEIYLDYCLGPIVKSQATDSPELIPFEPGQASFKV